MQLETCLDGGLFSAASFRKTECAYFFIRDYLDDVFGFEVLNSRSTGLSPPKFQGVAKICQKSLADPNMISKRSPGSLCPQSVTFQLGHFLHHFRFAAIGLDAEV